MEVKKIFLQNLALLALNQSINFEENLSTTVLELFNENYNNDFQIGTTIFVSNQNNIQNEILKQLNAQTTLTTFATDKNCTFDKSLQKDTINYFGQFNLVFIYNEDLEDLKQTIKCLNQTSIWRPRSKIVLIREKFTTKSSVEEIFRYMWKMKILNVILIAKLEGGVEILGFNPYFNNFYQKFTAAGAFYNKMTDLNGYVLNLLLVRDEDIIKLSVWKVGNMTFYGGKDGNTIMNIIKHMRGRFNVTNLSALYGPETNPWRAMNRIKDMDYSKYKIITEYDADFFLDAQEHFVQNFTENLYPHTRDDVVLIVPKAKIRSQYQQFVKIFNKGFAVIIILFTLVIPLIWCLLRLAEKKITSLEERNNIFMTFLDTYKLFLAVSVDTFKNSIVGNQFLIFLLFSNLIINNYFQSILSSVMIAQSKEPEIDTISDLNEAGLKPIYVYDAIRPEAIEILTATGQTGIISKIQGLPDNIHKPFLKTMDYSIFPKDMVGAWYRERADLGVIFLPHYHIVQETLIPKYLVFNVISGSPYFDLLNKYISWIMESGMYHRWGEMTRHTIVLKTGGPIEKEFYEESKRLTMKHLKIPFYLIYVGLGASFFTFVLEIFWFYIIQKFISRISAGSS